jgi:hypothetical protein
LFEPFGLFVFQAKPPHTRAQRTFILPNMKETHKVACRGRILQVRNRYLT